MAGPNEDRVDQGEDDDVEQAEDVLDAFNAGDAIRRPGAARDVAPPERAADADAPAPPG
jgi:hypothetical protein